MGHVGRRRFLAASGALFAANLVRADTARPQRIRTIGYLSMGRLNPKNPPSTWSSTKALKKLGWVDGENIRFERRFAERKPERLAALADELVRKRVDLIIANQAGAAVAAARATQSIPIVFIGVPFPDELELIESLQRPGRNVTGSATHERGATLKRFEFLREIAPEAKRLFHFGDPTINETVSGGTTHGFDRITAALAAMEFTLRVHRVRDDGDLQPALDSTLAWKAQALDPLPGRVNIKERHRIANFARKHRLPCISANLQFVEAGGLLSYGVGRAEWFTLQSRAMKYVDRILRGADPAEMPVEQPRTYDLVINRKTANELGLTIPLSLLLRADRVIE